MPTPRTLQRRRLDSLTAIRRELSQLYHDGRSGRLDTQDMTRLAYVLQTLAKVLESEAIEQRVVQLEHHRHDIADVIEAN